MKIEFKGVPNEFLKSKTMVFLKTLKDFSEETPP